ncbi:MAG: relaxase, partial [Gordonibacter urolithinfaciens]
ALEGIAESRGESVADVLSKAEGMERSIGAAEAAYFDAARNLSRVSGARDAAYAVAGLEPPARKAAGGEAVRPKPQGQESRGQRSRLAAEIHARHLEEARKKAVSRSAAASRAKQAAYQSAKSRNIAANVAAKEGRGASR